MTTIEKSSTFNSSDILFKAWTYRKLLIIIAVSAFVLSTVVAFIITPLYKSAVVILPAPSTSIARSYKNKTMYGKDPETERLLQVLQSDEMRLYMARLYNLYRHYDIDTTSIDKGAKLQKKYEHLVTIERTEFMAIGIEVMDESPDTAAMMANDIARYSDTIMNAMEGKRNKLAFEIIQNEYNIRVKEAEKLNDSLKKLMSLGVVDFESQARALNKEYAHCIAKGEHSGAGAIKKQLALLQEYGPRALALRNYLKTITKDLASLEVRCHDARLNADNALPHSYVINKAVVPDKKAFPQRALIIILATLSAIVLGFLTIVVLETINNFKKLETEQEKD